MDTHRLTSVQLTQFYLQRIRQLNPTLHAVITVSPTALDDARAADAARGRGDQRPLLGIPIIVKDNINTTGMPTTAGSWALAGSTPHDAFIVRAAQGRRCADHRQGQPVRVGELPVRSVVERLERNRRPDEHGLRARSQSLRLELRLRRGRVRQSRRRRCRHRDRRFDRLPLRRQRERGHQANPWAAEPRGHRPDLGRSGHRRANGPQRDGRRGAARRNDRRGPRRSGHGRRRPATPSGTTGSSSMPARCKAPALASGASSASRSTANRSTSTSPRSWTTRLPR